MNLAIRPGQLGEIAFCLALLDELEEAFKVEPGRGSANKTFSDHVQGERVRVVRPNFLNVVNGSFPRELNRCQQGVRPGSWNAVTGCSADSVLLCCVSDSDRAANASRLHSPESEDARLCLLKIRAKTSHGTFSHKLARLHLHMKSQGAHLKCPCLHR